MIKKMKNIVLCYLQERQTYSIIPIEHSFFLLFAVSVKIKMKKKEESIEILKILGLINNIDKYKKYKIMPEENMNQEFRLKKQMQ